MQLIVFNALTLYGTLKRHWNVGILFVGLGVLSGPAVSGTVLLLNKKIMSSVSTNC